MRARRLKQSDLARRGDMDTARLSRIVSGGRKLTPESQAILARVLQCGEGDLHQPIGAPIPPIAPRHGGPARPSGFDERLQAVLIVLGVEQMEDLIHWLLSGDPVRLPEPLVRRLREALEADVTPACESA